MTLLAYNGGSLTHLNLGYVENITDDSIAMLGVYTYCLKLVKLNLENVNHITMEILSQRLVNMPHLQSLNLKLVRGLTSVVLRNVIFNCKQLRELYLDSNFHVDVLLLQTLTLITTLERLCLSNIPCLSGSLLKAIVSSCTGLKMLDISSNYQVSDDWFLILCGQLHQLESLSVRCCSNISSIALLSLARHCHSLTDIDLYGCVAITDESLISLITRNPNLVSLDLGNCIQLTDATLNSLIQVHPRRLSSLNVRNCNAMSSRCIYRLVQALPRLRDLYVAQDQLDNEPKLRKCNPDLSIDIFC